MTYNQSTQGHLNSDGLAFRQSQLSLTALNETAERALTSGALAKTSAIWRR